MSSCRRRLSCTRGLLTALASFAAWGAFAYEVSVGDSTVADGESVTVSVSLDSAAGLSYASARISYDPTVLSVTKVEAGTLQTLMPEDFLASDRNGQVFVAIFGSSTANVVSGSGTIAEVTFTARANTRGRASDLTISKVELGEISGVKDVTFDNPLTIRSGTVRVTDVGIVLATDADCGEGLTDEAKNRIRGHVRSVFEGRYDPTSYAKKRLYESATRIAITGPKGLVSTIADMGLSPTFPTALDESGTLHLAYAQPGLAIVGFEPATGEVRFKVTPGEGNRIVSEIASGVIHVYGTDDLAEKMTYVSSVGFDLTPYLESGSQGEGIVILPRGTHAFLKVKIEKTPKVEGDPE